MVNLSRFPRLTQRGEERSLKLQHTSDVSVVGILLLIETCFAGRVGREGVLFGSGLGVYNVTHSFCLPFFPGLFLHLLSFLVLRLGASLPSAQKSVPCPGAVFKKKTCLSWSDVSLIRLAFWLGVGVTAGRESERPDATHSPVAAG